jgi:hypothetical protein
MGLRRISSATLQHHESYWAKSPPRLSVLMGLAGEEMALIWLLLCCGSKIRGLGQARYLVIARNSARVSVMCIAHNMKRAMGIKMAY